ncbi:hypothetical protein HBB16_19365 [Pseudonocardia sp. MCCB 268]|nr:hypothetical protein [Pseudonocardia cytotoxica]
MRLLRRFMPVTDDYEGHPADRTGARTTRAHAALAVVKVTALFVTDVVFAVDSVPAIYGITADPTWYSPPTPSRCSATARSTFVLHAARWPSSSISTTATAVILAFIGLKLVLLGPRNLASHPANPRRSPSLSSWPSCRRHRSGARTRRRAEQHVIGPKQHGD